DGARTAQRDAAAAGLRLLEAEASLLLADGLMAAGRAPELEAATEALSELANLLDAPRLRYHAAFYEGHDEIGVLERLAAEDRVAPTVARRARALLGAPIALDAIDERVLSTARLAWAGRRVVTVCGVEPGEWTPAWGIDPAEGIVWLPDGRTISLA